MPRGTFVPFENPTRFFARLRAFTCECPYCGRLLFIGPGERDAKRYNRVTSIVQCPGSMRAGKNIGGCGRKFLVGIVAWPIRLAGSNSPKAQTPPDQIPESHQLAEIRAFAQGRFARQKKGRGENANQLEPPIALDDLPGDEGVDPS